MTTSQGSLSSLVTLEKKRTNDDEPPGSLSFFTLDEKKQRDDDELRLFIVICYT
jgi:hypothetical protein